MINRQLTAPKSIAVLGGSNDLKKPGGKLVSNLIAGRFSGQLTVVNPRQSSVQGLTTVNSIEDLAPVELAILAIPAADCLAAVEHLIEHQGTRAFIIISAGFGEVDEQGRELELKIKATVDRVDGCLIGPNCIGVLNRNYQGVFTTPIPQLSSDGCDLVSSSGATAVFIMEAGIPQGLRFCNVFSVGNAVQTSVEDVLESMDHAYREGESSRIKLLYMETITDPEKFLRHASSLVSKGCKLAAIKSGSTAAGSRAAASHTGALASSDRAVRALFRKSGVVYCSSREELISVASVFYCRPLSGRNIAVITHAGGSAVMLADALSKGGLEIPLIDGADAEQLLGQLHPGSSVSNPIDFLATGTAEQLGIIIDYCENQFDQIDAMVVVFGSPGLFDVENVYRVLADKLRVCKKPILPVLPSLINAQREIRNFLSKGHINFPDEVVLGNALAQVYHTPLPMLKRSTNIQIDGPRIRQIIDQASAGFLPGDAVRALLQSAGIPQVEERTVNTVDDAVATAQQLGYPLAMKVVGPVHKSDVSGVVLHVSDGERAAEVFQQLMTIEGATRVMMQPMLEGVELFIGGYLDPRFGHLVFVGLGGVFVEVLQDVQCAMLPLERDEVRYMLRRLRGYPLFSGTRGMAAVDEDRFCELVLRIARLLELAPEIAEIDFNPLIGKGSSIVSVDARIKVDG
jgi:acetyltransferase